MLTDFPAESVLKTKCLLGTKTVSPWIAWAYLEEMKGNIGNYSTEYSSAWLYRESCFNQNPTHDISIYAKWAMFAHKYPMTDATGELIDIKYILNESKKFCLTTNDQTWKDLEKFIEKLI